MPKLGIVSDLVSNGRVLDRLQWTLRRTFAIVIFPIPETLRVSRSSG